MNRSWFLIAALLLISGNLLNAQDESRVSVYMCHEDGECAHSVTSQAWSHEEATVVLGEEAPSEEASIVCSADAGCLWTDLTESELESAAGGDGVINPIESMDMETCLADLLTLDFDALNAETADTSENVKEKLFWVVICQGEMCRPARSKITQTEAELLTGEDAPEGEAFVLCQEEGCAWQLWAASIQPLDGTWFLETYSPTASNCPEGGIPINQLVTSGERETIFSKPAQPADIFPNGTSAFDRVREVMIGLNNYVLSLGVGSGQFASQVVYDWTVIEETFVVGIVVIDIPSIFGGRCIVHIPWDMRHQAD